MRIYTIGFSKKSAEQFFGLLQNNNVTKLIDVRLNTQSQLSGFAKGRDLAYFLKKICNIEYKHFPELAPSKELLNDYRKKFITWEEYVIIYNSLISKRNKLQSFQVEHFVNACLLCSEATPEQCHRRLAAEFLAEFDSRLEIIHL
ncbi:MAG: DUF488 domain-containing protein [Bacteroidales bacterium]|nr:DUF488 domain-containing protein [Bacteroidales bacterium]